MSVMCLTLVLRSVSGLSIASASSLRMVSLSSIFVLSAVGSITSRIFVNGILILEETSHHQIERSACFATMLGSGVGETLRRHLGIRKLPCSFNCPSLYTNKARFCMIFFKIVKDVKDQIINCKRSRTA